MKTNDLIAAVDVGTNTIRLLIGRLDKGRLVRLHSDRFVTRLGKDLLKTGILHPAAVEASLKALNRIKRKCDKFKVRRIFAVGTSALREAKNGREFRARAKEETGIDIRTISGRKEAELTLRGIMGQTEHRRQKTEVRTMSTDNLKDIFIVDIGGGSTEWILYGGQKTEDRSQKSEVRSQTTEDGSQKSEVRQRKTEDRSQKSEMLMGSIPIGAVKLAEAFIKHDPPLPAELETMTEHIRTALPSSFSLDAPRSTPDAGFSLSFIATGGTPTTLAAVDMRLQKYDGDRVHMHKITLPFLRKMLRELVSLPMKKRRAVTGMGPGRADIIIPGALILLTVMEYLKAKKVIASDYGLLEGLLMSGADRR